MINYLIAIFLCFLSMKIFSMEITPEVQKKRDEVWAGWIRDYDFNKDGVFTKEEFLKANDEAFKKSLEKQKLKNPAAAAHPEFMAKLEQMKSSLRDVALKQFEAMDKNKDGKVEKGEPWK